MPGLSLLQHVWLWETQGSDWGNPCPLPHSHRQLEQLEGKRSGLAKELVEVREALSGATLQRDMLQAEKAEVAEALAKVGSRLPPRHKPTSVLRPRPSPSGHRLTPSSGTQADLSPGPQTDL